ncbi:PaaI family thioesterase [Rhabdothermincola salaria]|uniref:PaaI family thioesterase n=1 Tax=Rhabdothermincola salaria TaxID=2903142 RepID=UPI001E5717B2|nr:PaaI family thioesterase [Rhabdothermincola salaria]MCD9624990.1 PaaI family thioesterase [Rhabdothermincola salaria]
MSDWDDSLEAVAGFDPFTAWMPTPVERLTPSRVAARRLAQATRGILERLSGTTASAADLEEVAVAVEEALARLEAGVDPEGPGGELGYAEAALAAAEPHRLFERSPYSGRANPVAPPLDMSIAGGEVVGRATCGRTYEGPPGHVHGGVVAGLFDEILGAAQGLSGKAGMTGRLTVHYRRPTPLDTELELRARPELAEGRKIVVRGTLHAGDVLCAEGEGLFIAVDFERLQSLGVAGPDR